MPRDLKAILKLRVPVIVRIGERRMPLDDVLALSPGAIVELPKPAELPLDLMVNNKVVGLGSAVKIGENFGLRVLEVGDARSRVRAMAEQVAAARRPAEAVDPDDLAEAVDPTNPADPEIDPTPETATSQNEREA